MSDGGSPPAVTIAALQVGWVGGEELATAELVEGLRSRGHRVTVIAARCELSESSTLTVVRMPIPVRPALITRLLLPTVGSFIVWRRREGLLHTVSSLFLNRRDVATAHFCSVAFAAQKGAPRRSRDTLAHRVNEWCAQRLHSVSERWSYRPARASRLVSVSSGGAAELAELFPAMAGRIEVIPNAVDHRFRFDPSARERLRRELGLAEHDRVALFVGGDWGRKRLRLAIEAVALAPEWRLLVVGGGDRAAYEQLASRVGAGERVRFCGPTANTAPYYSAADAFVLPSEYETFAMVAHEAAATGLPLVATPVSGVEDLVVDGQNGWLASGDPREIAGCLEALGGHPELRRKLGAGARAAVEDLTWEHVVDAYEELYERLLRDAEVRRPERPDGARHGGGSRARW